MQELIREAVLDLANALPGGWTKAWLRVEILPDGSGGTAAAYAVCAAEPTRAVPVSLEPGHLLRWQALWTQCAEAHEPWTSATLTLSDRGNFSTDYSYEPLEDEPPLARQARWAKTVLSDLG